MWLPIASDVPDRSYVPSNPFRNSQQIVITDQPFFLGLDGRFIQSFSKNEQDLLDQCSTPRSAAISEGLREHLSA